MKTRKTYERIRNNPCGVRFHDLCKVAEAFGFRFVRQTGSHAFYSNPSIPTKMNFQEIDGMAKPYQVKQLLDAIDRFGLTMED